MLAVTFPLLPSAGTLKDRGIALTANQFVSAADIATGKLVFVPDANQTGTGLLCQFQVQDTGGTSTGGVDLDPTPKTLNVSLVDVNRAPTGTTGTVATLEDMPYVFQTSDFGSPTRTTRRRTRY